jgi:hypothetical protein
MMSVMGEAGQERVKRIRRRQRWFALLEKREKCGTLTWGLLGR